MAKNAKEQQTPRLYWLAVVAFAALLILLFYARPAILDGLQRLGFDAFQRAAPAPALEASPIKVVVIDEASLEALGQWPWSRDTMATLTRNLGQAGAAAIVFDVIFAEADRTSPEQMLARAPAGRRDALLRALGSPQPHDRQFAEALGAYPSVLAASLHQDENEAVFPMRAGLALAGDDPGSFLRDYRGVAGNLAFLEEAAAGQGFINWIPDGDQVVRRVPMLLRHNGEIRPSLSLEALRVATGASTYVVRAANASGVEAFGANSGVESIRVGPLTTPTDAEAQVWVRFRHYQPADAISAASIVNGAFDPAAFDGAIVLIGASAPGLLDLRATPLDAAIPGVEIHRQVLEQIVSGAFLTRPDYAPGLELLVALALVGAFALAAPRLKPGANAAAALGVVIVLWGGAFYLFTARGLLFDPVFPTLATLAFGAAATTYFYQRAEAQRAGIRRAFSQYVAPSVVRELVTHPERLKLGGDVRELTLLVCDIRDFSAIAETLNAEEVTAFVNSFLTPVSDIIIENGGTIDKYMGDAVLAFWNAPTDQADHAARACNAALQIMARLKDLNARWRQDAADAGRPFKDVRIGIGINTGECCVGNMGSERRFDYSAIGDAVNIAARLESLSKVYGLPLLASEDTARRVGNVAFIEVDLVQLKGRDSATRVFTALLSEPAPAEHQAFRAAFHAGRLDEARTLVTALSEKASPALAALYAHFATRLDGAAPSSAHTWDGVFHPERK